VEPGSFIQTIIGIAGETEEDRRGCRSWSRRPCVRATGADAADAVDRLAERTQAAGTSLAVGIEARCRALISNGSQAEELYLNAIDLLGRTRMRLHRARAQLLYGEWLRRENRRVDARRELRNAYEAFADGGADAFAERTSRELRVTGEIARKRTDDTHYHLTAQETQIARLAGQGLTNPEIGARLCLSPRTVEWHLRKVFTKLSISSRRELRSAVPAS
jgi:DNA-binding CsgD family transcriptional regulator